MRILVDSICENNTITLLDLDTNIIGVDGDILLDEIATIINSLDFLELGHAFLMTAEGKVLSHPNTKMVDQHFSKLFGMTPVLTAQLTELEGKNQIVSFIRIEGIESVTWYLGVVLDKDKAYQPLADARTQAMIFGVIAVIITIVLLNLLLGQLLKPINGLTKAIKRISEGDGDLTQRLDVRSQDEIGQLSQHFNDFIETIHHSMQKTHEAANALDEQIDQVRQSAKYGIDYYKRGLASYDKFLTLTKSEQFSNDIKILNKNHPSIWQSSLKKWKGLFNFLYNKKNKESKKELNTSLDKCKSPSP